MSFAICFVTLVLCGALSDAASVGKKSFSETGDETNYSPCVVRGVTYQHGERTGDPCNRCRCSNGFQLCNRMGCRINGEEVSPYRE